MTILARDKVFPGQPFLSSLYQGGSYTEALADFVTAYSPDGQPLHGLTVPADVDLEEMSSPPMILALLSFLAGRSTRVLEIGTFVGRTAMHLAQGAHVTTIESVERFAAVAAKNFREYDYGDRITLLVGNALDVLGMLRGDYGLIYMDGGKQNYPLYAETCERLLARNGAMVIDDVFFHGDALNSEPSTDKGSGCRAVMERYRDHNDFRSCLLPIGNGVLLVTRR